MASPSNSIIFQAAVDCLEAFDKCLSITQLYPFDDQVGRFRLWAANINALSNTRASLDYRLSESEKTRNMVLQVLRALQMNLAYVVKIVNSGESVIDISIKGPSHDSDSTSTSSASSWTSEVLQVNSDFPPSVLEVLRDVNSNITSLQRLSMAIRNASKKDRADKIAAFEPTNQEDIALRQDLADHASWIMQYRYPKSKEEVRNRLLATILLRQKRFLYRKSRRDQNRVPGIRPNVQMPILTAQAPKSVVKAKNWQTSSSEKVRSESRGGGAPSQHTASAFDEILFEANAPQPQKTASSVRSLKQDKILEWPAPPKRAPGGIEKECPYCFDFLVNGALEDKKLWRKHLKNDLEPYSCYFDECQDQIQTLSNFQQWLEHSRDAHGPRSWFCSVKAHNRMVFSNEDEFRDHMLSEHPGTFTVSQLQMLVQMNSKPSPRPFTECPLCGGFPDDCPTVADQEARGIPDQLPRHIAGHLKELALLSLLPTDEVDRTNKVTASVENLIEQSDVGSESLTFSEASFRVNLLADSEIHVSTPQVFGTGIDFSASGGELLDEAWLAGSSGLSGSNREDEWGFSRFTQYPDYTGPMIDDNLKMFIERAKTFQEKSQSLVPNANLESPDTESASPQPNDVIRDFKSKLAEFTVRGVCGRFFVLVSKLAEWLTCRIMVGGTETSQVDRLISHVYRPLRGSSPPITKQQLCDSPDCCVIIFSILLELEAGSLVDSFWRAEKVDSTLPLDSLSLKGIFESVTRPGTSTLADGFEKLQWRFCPARFSLYGSLEHHQNRIIPISRKQLISSKGAFAKLWEIEVPEEFVDLDLGSLVKSSRYDDVDNKLGPRYHFALKCFEEGEKAIYMNEKEALMKLRHKSSFIRYLGAYGHREIRRTTITSGSDNLVKTTEENVKMTYNIILEYADLDLDIYFAEFLPPEVESEISSFWSRLFEVADAIDGIHNLVANSIGKVQEFSGWHADIKPENVLVVQGMFKLASPAFAKFFKKTEETPREIMLGGTMTYGAPECHPRKQDGLTAVSQTIDIWSLGCVFSIAATWLCLGYRGIGQFSDIRQKAIGKAIQERRGQHLSIDTPIGHGDNFHDGVQVLGAVTGWHNYLRGLVRKTDKFTTRVLDLVDERMLIGNPTQRLRSFEICRYLTNLTLETGVEPEALAPGVIDWASVEVNKPSNTTSETGSPMALQSPAASDASITSPEPKIGLTSLANAASSSLPSFPRNFGRTPKQNVFQARKEIEGRKNEILSQIKEKDSLLSRCFSTRDIKFLVDNADSMQPHWFEVTYLLETLLMKTLELDEDGTDLYFTSGSVKVRYSGEDKAKIKKTMDDVNVRPREGRFTNMSISLGEIFEQYLSYLSMTPRSSKTVRELTVIVLTDGIWADAMNEHAVHEAIVSFNKACMEIIGKRATWPVSIEFVQFGIHEGATLRLQMLVNDLMEEGIPHTIDIEPSTGDVNKMLLGSIIEEYGKV